jgi:hypothetical protein
VNLSKPVSMDLIDRIERTIQFTECNNTVDLLRECEEEISKLRAALELWHLATKINVTMEGPQYMGVSFILGRQAWERTRAALGGDK